MRVLTGIALVFTALTASAGMVEVSSFGSNPGNLRMFKYTPKEMKNPRSLVIVLHGCLQTVQDFDDEPGWTAMAERGGFEIVFPEQKKDNNGAQCFNWFQPEDSKPGSGEMESIRQMMVQAIKEDRIGANNVFLAGFSSGGAVASALLANFPETFKAAAIFSGVPFGCANSVNDGFLCMNGMYKKTAQEWGDFVRKASSYTGPRARVAVWHGTNDGIIKPVVGGELVKQWTNVLGAQETPAQDKKTAFGSYQTFTNSNGDVVVEYYQINKMKHGVPIKPGNGKDACGKHGSYVLDAGICASYVMTRTWGLLGEND